MQTLYLLRHGETDWNAENRMQGQIAHVPLNDKGIAQARQAAETLRGIAIDLIVASPLIRAAQTAEIIQTTLQVPLIYDDRLIERCWGVGEGKTPQELASENPNDFYTDDGQMDWVTNTRQPKGSETKDNVAARAQEAVTGLLAAHHDKTLLLVTHGAWIRALIYGMTGEDRIIPNAAAFAAHKNAGGWSFTQMQKSLTIVCGARA